MRRLGSAALVALVLAAAGCGSASVRGQRALDTFLLSRKGQTWAARYPHTPGSIPCSTYDKDVKKKVDATCSTDLSVDQRKRVIVIFTTSWSHGSRARAWFVFLRPDGALVSITREGATD